MQLLCAPAQRERYDVLKQAAAYLLFPQLSFPSLGNGSAVDLMDIMASLLNLDLDSILVATLGRKTQCCIPP